MLGEPYARRNHDDAKGERQENLHITVSAGAKKQRLQWTRLLVLGYQNPPPHLNGRKLTYRELCKVGPGGKTVYVMDHRSGRGGHMDSRRRNLRAIKRSEDEENGGAVSS